MLDPLNEVDRREDEAFHAETHGQLAQDPLFKNWLSRREVTGHATPR